jgi:hypothetical protein
MTSRTPTEEELYLVRESILLPFLLTIVDKNMRQLEMEQLGLKTLYTAVAEVLMDNIHADLAQIRKTLRE